VRAWHHNSSGCGPGPGATDAEQRDGHSNQESGTPPRYALSPHPLTSVDAIEHRIGCDIVRCLLGECHPQSAALPCCRGERRRMPQMDHRSLVFDPGDEICGWGRFVCAFDGDWFDPPLPVPAIGYGSEGPSPLRPSSYGIPVEGAQFDAVEDGYGRGGAIEGFAKIHGMWFADRIGIHLRTKERPKHAFRRCSDPPVRAPSRRFQRPCRSRDRPSRH
jgi:hypothetical protein